MRCVLKSDCTRDSLVYWLVGGAVKPPLEKVQFTVKIPNILIFCKKLPRDKRSYSEHHSFLLRRQYSPRYTPPKLEKLQFTDTRLEARILVKPLYNVSCGTLIKRTLTRDVRYIES
jgi:hypothetical protein